MRIIVRTLFCLTLFIAILVFSMEDVMAQCPMCKMTAESNLNDGGSGGKGLNAGILFILSLPYLLVGSIGYLWWKNQRGISE